jgi:terminal uridylyltransferase
MQQRGNPMFEASSVQLKCFGSMASGFATKSSDMDLALLSPLSTPSPDSGDSPIPRILEKRLLEAGLGARLLTRTRVPIIKLCQMPSEELKADLLDERQKWESGSTLENVEDDFPNDADHKLDDDAAHIPDMENNDDITPDAPEALYRRRLASLRQLECHTLGDYYGNAKRLLFKLGGRDVGLGGVAEMSDEDIKILEDVSRAFIQRLADPGVKSRLTELTPARSEEDLSISRTSPLLSLSGVYCQAEGERLVMAWAARPLPEPTDRQESTNHRYIEEWQALRAKMQIEPSAHNKQLHQALDRLKRIPSIQLALLEQASFESPLQYGARASRISRELGVTDGSTVANLDAPVNGLSVVVNKYVEGISDATTREEIAAAITRSHDPSLDEVFMHHRMLHLANDYERGLASAIYDPNLVPAIEQYISSLRFGPNPQNPVDLHQHMEFLRSDPTVLSIVEILKRLPEPTVVHKSRDRYFDRLEFPKLGVGIQCDINFSAELGLHNTLLLRCYSSADPRLRPLALFVKSWAKIRGINTPYRGTLSSYGYVLMMIHYLVNIASPFVLPNLQQLRREPPAYLSPEEREKWDRCQGYDVGFWRNEVEIQSLAARGMLNHNHDSIGKLLRGFFEYYAQSNFLSDGCGKRGFEWGREVLSLRTQGGILSKQEKGWVGARTTHEPVTKPRANPHRPTSQDASQHVGNLEPSKDSQPSQKPAKEEVEVKEVRHRYLFAIEDPFEITHNVARTVTHNGIVSIRDEFRRAWRIIKEVTDRRVGEKEDLLAQAEGETKEIGLRELLDLIHRRT